MLYKKQLKRMSRKMVRRHKKRHGISDQEISPIVEKAHRKAKRIRIGNGQVLMSRTEWGMTRKGEWLIVAEECLTDEVWVIKRKKYA